jgi:hypothetical protein
LRFRATTEATLVAQNRKRKRVADVAVAFHDDHSPLTTHQRTADLDNSARFRKNRALL